MWTSQGLGVSGNSAQGAEEAGKMKMRECPGQQGPSRPSAEACWGAQLRPTCPPRADSRHDQRLLPRLTQQPVHKHRGACEVVRAPGETLVYAEPAERREVTTAGHEGHLLCPELAALQLGEQARWGGAAAVPRVSPASRPNQPPTSLSPGARTATCQHQMASISA